MRKSTVNLAVCSALLLVVVLACSMSTANLSSLKVGKDKAVTSETSTFGPNDTIYAIGTVSNAPGKVKVKGRIAFDDVAGQQPGPVPGAETTVDLPGSGTAIYTFTPPPNGWPNGKYKVEVTMMDDSGTQKDQKTATFTVS